MTKVACERTLQIKNSEAFVYKTQYFEHLWITCKPKKLIVLSSDFVSVYH